MKIRLFNVIVGDKEGCASNFYPTLEQAEKALVLHLKWQKEPTFFQVSELFFNVYDEFLLKDDEDIDKIPFFEAWSK